MTKSKECFITTRYFIKATGTVICIVRNGGGKEYQVTITANGLSSCSCPARGMCYHRKHVESKESARVSLAVGNQKVDGATPAQAVKKAVKLMQKNVEGTKVEEKEAACSIPVVSLPVVQEEEPVVLAASAAPRKREQAPCKGDALDNAKYTFNLDGSGTIHGEYKPYFFQLVTNSVYVRIYGCAQKPGFYSFPASRGKANNKHGSMGKKQHELCDQLQAELQKRMHEELIARGWTHAGKHELVDDCDIYERPISASERMESAQLTRNPGFSLLK